MDTGQRIYYWVVPAKVEGSWIVPVESKDKTIGLRLEQEYQNIQGSARIDGRQIPIQDGKVEGKKVTFSLATPQGKRSFQGRLENGKITGRLVALRAQAPASSASVQ